MAKTKVSLLFQPSKESVLLPNKDWKIFSSQVYKSTENKLLMKMNREKEKLIKNIYLDVMRKRHWKGKNKKAELLQKKQFSLRKEEQLF